MRVGIGLWKSHLNILRLRMSFDPNFVDFHFSNLIESLIRSQSLFFPWRIVTEKFQISQITEMITAQSSKWVLQATPHTSRYLQSHKHSLPHAIGNILLSTLLLWSEIWIALNEFFTYPAQLLSEKYKVYLNVVNDFLALIPSSDDLYNTLYYQVSLQSNFLSSSLDVFLQLIFSSLFFLCSFLFDDFQISMLFKPWEGHLLQHHAQKQVCISPNFVLWQCFCFLCNSFSSLFSHWNTTWKCHSHQSSFLPIQSIHRSISMGIWSMLQWISLGELYIFIHFDCVLLIFFLFWWK